MSIDDEIAFKWVCRKGHLILNLPIKYSIFTNYHTIFIKKFDFKIYLKIILL